MSVFTSIAYTEAIQPRIARISMQNNCRAGAPPANVKIGNRSGCPTNYPFGFA